MINLFKNERKEEIQKYNIIIVPEKKGSSKVFSLSINTIRILASLIIFIMLIIFICAVKYGAIARKALQAEKNEKIVNSLQIENKQKQEKINNYKKYQLEINKKLNQLQNIENNIKTKVKSSSTLKGISFDEKSLNDKNVTYSRGNTLNIDSKNLIKRIDNEIKNYSILSQKVDNIVSKEQYIINLMPCSGNISSYFGYRKNPFRPLEKDFHPGIDLAADYGSKVYASAAGTVTFSGNLKGYGKTIMIDHHNGYVTLYAHNSKLLMTKGSRVKKGQLISLVGSTGSSTGPHLHFEVRKNGTSVDPLKILKGGYITVNKTL